MSAGVNRPILFSRASGKVAASCCKSCGPIWVRVMAPGGVCCKQRSAAARYSGNTGLPRPNTITALFSPGAAAGQAVQHDLAAKGMAAGQPYIQLLRGKYQNVGVYPHHLLVALVQIGLQVVTQFACFAWQSGAQPAGVTIVFCCTVPFDADRHDGWVANG